MGMMMKEAKEKFVFLFNKKMRPKYIGIILLVFVLIIILPLLLMNKKTEITGTYSWSGYSEDSKEELNKSINVSRNNDGSITLKLTYKAHSVLKDNSFDINGGTYINSTVTLDSKVKLGKVITVNTDSEIEQLKHQFIFNKGKILWRYCVIQNNINNESKDENIDDKEYCVLEK